MSAKGRVVIFCWDRRMEEEGKEQERSGRRELQQQTPPCEPRTIERLTSQDTRVDTKGERETS